MKDILFTLLKRNGIIIAVYAIAMFVIFFVPQFAAVGFYLMLFLMLGLIWANGVLVQHMSRLLAALITAVLTLGIGSGVVLITIQIQKLLGR